MARHLPDKTGCLEACQKRGEKLTAILWIQLKITGGSRWAQKELLINSVGFLYRAELLSVHNLSGAQQFIFHMPTSSALLMRADQPL